MVNDIIRSTVALLGSLLAFYILFQNQKLESEWNTIIFTYFAFRYFQKSIGRAIIKPKSA